MPLLPTRRGKGRRSATSTSGSGCAGCDESARRRKRERAQVPDALQRFRKGLPADGAGGRKRR